MNHGFIGFGNMAKAIYSGLRENENNKFLYISKTNTHNEIEPASELKILIDESEIIWLCIKPQILNDVLEDLKQYDLSKKTIVSVIAGKSIKHIQDKLNQDITIVRTMPNLAIAYKKSVTAFCVNRESVVTNKVKQCLRKVGEVVEIEEKHFDLFTALFGSGPAFILEIMNVFKGQIKKLDVSDSNSNKLLSSLFKGTITHFQKNSAKQDIKNMVSNITSKGGTTEAGLKFYQENNLSEKLEGVIDATSERSKNMSKQTT